jgi:hypothetical protein
MPGSGVRVSPQLLKGSPAESNGVQTGRRFAFSRGRIRPRKAKAFYCNPIPLWNTGKGTLADEGEMDSVNFSGKILNANTIDLYWESRHFVRSNCCVNYAVSA